MATTKRILPVGIQSFREIREKGYLYVDKTDLMWKLANEGKKYNYLSRPRRFGKSLLIDTLQAYFEGRRDLFEGLKVMTLEPMWTVYPVIRLDMSAAGTTAESLRSYFNYTFRKYESIYPSEATIDDSLAVRLDGIITGAYKQTGKQVVILIDEHDAPLQHSWQTPYHEGCVDVYREVFAILKTLDAMERFVFITGVTKFTQISLFSVLNNLSNISFDASCAELCGISEQEMITDFMPEIEQMAACNGWTVEQTIGQLKSYYDGYHFSADNMADIYNPFSLINALSDKRLKSYWASSGATMLLPKFVSNIEISLDYFDHCAVDDITLESSDVTGGPELFLYQSGYITIKSHDEYGYILGIPNEEVRQALNAMVLPALTLRKESETRSLQSWLARQLDLGQLDEAKKSLRSLIADVPYSNKKLASMHMEERYRLIISTILNAVGIRVEVERMLATGRIDLVAWTSRFIYVIELKLSSNGGMVAAEQQIRSSGYTEPFKADSRKVIGLAIELDDLGKGLIDWRTIE